MNLEAAKMTMPQADAERAYRAYRTAIDAKRATADDAILYRALRTLLRGKTVIDINVAIPRAGLDAQNRPRIAIGRADADRVFVRKDSYGREIVFSTSSYNRGRRPKGEVRISARLFEQLQRPVGTSIDGHAMTPTIPPQFRPRGDLREYHLLWEAEWFPKVPVDPVLLKHVAGPFFVALAAWNLTPLEQAMLRTRL